jgi:hypothetical protein
MRHLLPSLLLSLTGALALAQNFLPKPIQWSPIMDAPAKPLMGANLVADPAFPLTENYIRPRIGATAAG